MHSRTLNSIGALAASLALVVVAGASSASAADNQSIGIDNFAFAPAEVTVSAGTTLTWTNQQGVRHTATADDGTFDSSILTNGQSFAFTFDTPGDFAYHCDIHPDMLGVVHVLAAEPAPVAIEVPAPAIEAPAPALPTPTPSSTYYGY